MNKTLLAILIASSVSLVGCGDDATTTGEPTISPEISESLKAETKINFNLVSSDPDELAIVTPSYLVMDSVDGTIKTDGDVGSDDYQTNIMDPKVALGKTDGWSTNQPFIIEFTGNDLDASTATDGFYLIETGDPKDKGYASFTPIPLTAANGDFMVTASGKKLIVTLLKPLKPASQYQFAITSDLKDSKGNAVGMSSTYAVLKSITQTPNIALEPAQKITHLSEATFEAIGVDKSKIIFSNWFTTASAGDVVYAAKAASAMSLKLGADNVWQGTAIDERVSSDDLSKLFTMTEPVIDPTASDDDKDVYKGNVYLPYYLETDAAKYSSAPWQSGMPSLATIKYVLENGEDADKAIVMAKLTELGVTLEDLDAVATDPAVQLRVLPLLTGQKIILSDGKPLDEERLITRYSPVPKLKSVQEVEYTLITPNADSNCQAVGANQVTIFQHGITSFKDRLAESTLSTEIVKNACNAIFAIDLPLHGTRGIEMPNGDTINAAQDPSIYLNLEYLPVGRDNVRQSITDQINLRLAIGLQFERIAKELEANTIDPSNQLNWLNPSEGVNFVGHSLGAITGIALGNVANREVDKRTDKLLFDINKLTLANPGAGIPYLLLDSTFFGDFVKGNLLAGMEQDFAKQFVKDCTDGDFMACYMDYEQGKILDGTEAAIAELSGVYEEFSAYAFAAQNILDTIDPINHAPQVSKELPVYMSMTIGDNIIPNSLTPGATVGNPIVGKTTILKPYSPFGGTLNLASEAQLGLTPATSSVSGNTQIKAAAYFTVGHHSSFMYELPIGPGRPATSEMQQHATSLINGDGTTLTVTNSSILTTTP